MSTFSKSTFKTLTYNSFRPRYPPSFYDIIINYANAGKPVSNALDIGCGTAIATFDLLNIADKVTGLDLSPSMVTTCNDLKPDRLKQLGIADESRIKFALGDIDELDPNEKYDLITAAQCLHWSKDFNKFFQGIHSILQPGGTLAYWYYVDPIVVDFQGESKLDKADALKAVKEIYLKYCYNDPTLMGPHWEQPGRSVIKDGYEAINTKIPTDLFTDIKINNYYPNLDNYKPPSESSELTLVKKCTIKDIVNYLTTYSGLHNFLQVNKDSTLVQDFEKEVLETTGWTDSTPLDLVFNTGYTLVKKI